MEVSFNYEQGSLRLFHLVDCSDSSVLCLFWIATNFNFNFFVSGWYVGSISFWCNSKLRLVSGLISFKGKNVT